MPITIDGSGTITGLSAGGLPDGTIQPADLSTGAPTWDTSGNVGIGVTPSRKLDISGTSSAGADIVTRVTNTDSNSSSRAAFQVKTGTSANVWQMFCRNNQLVFGVDTVADYAIIDSSNNLLIGRSSTGFDKTAYGWQIAKDAESFVTVNTAASCVTFNRNNTGDIFKFFRDGTQRGWISVETTGTTFGNLSDRREKLNFAPSPTALDKIVNVEVKSFDWKAGGHTEYGFIAQDLNTVLPFAVTAGDDGETVEKPWGIDNTKIVPFLVKAIQELNAKVEAQAAEIAILKGAA